MKTESDPKPATARTTDLDTLLSLSTGRLLGSMDQVHRALDLMTDDTLFTHQLPRAGRVAEPVLRETFPWLDDVELPMAEGTVDFEAWVAYREGLIAEHGDVFELPLIPGYVGREPLAELREKVGMEVPVIVVDVSSLMELGRE